MLHEIELLVGLRNKTDISSEQMDKMVRSSSINMLIKHFLNWCSTSVSVLLPYIERYLTLITPPFLFFFSLSLSLISFFFFNKKNYLWLHCPKIVT